MIDFIVAVKPREVLRGSNITPVIGVVYDVHVTDAHNGNSLVHSNQGYENRSEAVEIALKLFGGKRAQLDVHDGDGFLEETVDLSTSPI